MFRNGWKSLVVLAAVAGVSIGVATLAFAAEGDAKLIEDATAAAPAAVGSAATVVAIEADGSLRTVRKGSNNFTCIPDNPNSPGVDPMCVDDNGMAWVKAWIAQTPPPKGKVGFGYMLKGGSDASNTDPFATEPKSGEAWVDTGPHVMVFNAGDMGATYPKHVSSAKDTAVPYVMWAGTPYEHLMIPVE